MDRRTVEQRRCSAGRQAFGVLEFRLVLTSRYRQTDCVTESVNESSRRSRLTSDGYFHDGVLTNVMTRANTAKLAQGASSISRSNNFQLIAFS